METGTAAMLKCPKCRTPLPEPFSGAPEFAPCPGCGAKLQCEIFPALHAGLRIGRPGDPLVNASEASCFFHPEKRASLACENCGRFLCGLCDLEIGGRHLCPKCFNSGRKKGALRDLDHYRTSWPGIALLLTIAPLVGLSILMPFMAVAALVVLVIGWRKPGSITGKKWAIAWTLAVVLAVAELGASVVFGKQMLKTWTDATLHR